MFIIAEVFRVAKEDVAPSALNRAELPKKFCMLIRRITVEDFIGCATNVPYGSSPRVSVRVVDSSRDFNSAVVQLQARRTQIFGCLNPCSLWEEPPRP